MCVVWGRVHHFSLFLFHSVFYCLMHCRCASRVIPDCLALSLFLQIWSGVGYRLDDISDPSQSHSLTALLPRQPSPRTPAGGRPSSCSHLPFSLIHLYTFCVWQICIIISLPSPLSPLSLPPPSLSLLPFSPLIFPSVVEEPHLKNFDLGPRS